MKQTMFLRSTSTYRALTKGHLAIQYRKPGAPCQGRRSLRCASRNRHPELERVLEVYTKIDEAQVETLIPIFAEKLLPDRLEDDSYPRLSVSKGQRAVNLK